MEFSEPCPFCRTRIRTLRGRYGAKRCPVCGGEWFESGGGGGSYRSSFRGGGAAATTV